MAATCLGLEQQAADRLGFWCPPALRFHPKRPANVPEQVEETLGWSGGGGDAG
jgi:hypothetical protein